MAKIPGSGRKRGSLSDDRRTAREICQDAGVDPVRFLCNLIRKRKVPIDLKLDAAKALLKFVHPALSTQHVYADVSQKVLTKSQIEVVLGDPVLAEAAERLALALVETAEPDGTPSVSVDAALLLPAAGDTAEPRA